MPSSLNVIALISGGKDSFYSILHCLHHGHRLVALANLQPPKDNPSYDMESMMYQTIGHNVIPLYSETLDRPLYRYDISGHASCTRTDYEPTPSDETERIQEMLCLIINNHPECNAVSTGAIMSDYQRTRIESVAMRLNLIPLSFLWQYPILPPPAEREDSVSGLLDDMAAAGCDSRIIKTAHGNFDDSLIGMNVADPRTIKRLTALARRWVARNERELRATIVGEGGEYETITIDGPFPLWKWYIPAKAEDFKIVERQGYAIYGSLDDPKLAPKPEVAVRSVQPPLRIPLLLDDQFVAVKAGLTTHSEAPPHEMLSTVSVKDATSVAASKFPSLEAHTEHHIAVSNLQCSLPIEEFSAHIDILFQRCSELCQRVSDNRLGVHNVTFVVLQLASMRDFASVNQWYQKYFDVVNPPARVTIATTLPSDVRFSLSLIIDLRASQSRRGLHVQSRSYWAPANIGPYSQAIAEPLSTPHGKTPSITFDGEPELVHMAGQIPLLPCTMEIYQKPFLDQAILSLQHLWRIGQERQVDLWTWGVAFIPRHPQSLDRARTAIHVWQKAHSSPTRPAKDEEQDVDPWDAQRNFNFSSQHSAVMAGQGDHLHVLPSLDAFQSNGPAQRAAPCIVAEVSGLPRDAPIEWWSTGLANLPKNAPRVTSGGVDGNGSDTNVMAVHSLKCLGRANGEGSMDSDGAHFLTLTLYADSERGPEQLRRWISRMLAPRHKDGNPKRRVVHGMCFTAGEPGMKACQAVQGDWMNGIPIIPCRRLFVDNVGRKDCTSEVRQAILTLLLRTEEVEPKVMEKEHGRQT